MTFNDNLQQTIKWKIKEPYQVLFLDKEVGTAFFNNYDIIVATIFLAPPEYLNSQRYIPCQVPRLRRPLLIGIVSETPVRLDLAWLGMSSSPSSVWL